MTYLPPFRLYFSPIVKCEVIYKKVKYRYYNKDQRYAKIKESTLSQVAKVFSACLILDKWNSCIANANINGTLNSSGNTAIINSQSGGNTEKACWLVDRKADSMTGCIAFEDIGTGIPSDKSCGRYNLHFFLPYRFQTK